MKSLQPNHALIVHAQHHVHELHSQANHTALVNSLPRRPSQLKALVDSVVGLKNRLSQPQPQPDYLAETQEMPVAPKLTSY